jgi:hypothetical protein
MWTVFVFAFLRFLSALGLKSATAVPQPATQQPATQHSATQHSATQPVTQPFAPFIPAAAEPLPCELLYGPPDEGFLPPTIKQRIRAEAHGATPTSRRMSRGIAEVSHDGPANAFSDSSQTDQRSFSARP